MFRTFYSLLRGRIVRQTVPVVDYEYMEQIENARMDLRDLIFNMRCAPIMLRLAWQDAATYDMGTETGGPNGSIRFEEEYCLPANNGLKFALDICEELKFKYPKITYADLYQLAGVVAVEVTGGPNITFTPGRTVCPPHTGKRNQLYEDSISSHLEWSKLPSPTADANHLRLVFYRMGFYDREIVALSGAHTLGRAHQERSGYDGPWTDNPLKFDNSYFVALTKPESEGLLRLPTDNVLIQDPVFHQYVLDYAEFPDYFFESYAEAHRKFSELGYNLVTQEKWTTNNSILLFTASLIGVVALRYFLYQGGKKPK